MSAEKETHSKAPSQLSSTTAAISIHGQPEPYCDPRTDSEILPHSTTSSTSISSDSLHNLRTGPMPALEIFSDTTICEPLHAHRHQAAHLEPRGDPILSDKENTVLEFEGIIIPPRRPLMPRPKLTNQTSMLAEKTEAKPNDCGERWEGKIPFGPCSPTQERQTIRSELSPTPETPIRRGSGLAASVFRRSEPAVSPST